MPGKNVLRLCCVVCVQRHRHVQQRWRVPWLPLVASLLLATLRIAARLRRECHPQQQVLTRSTDLQTRLRLLALGARRKCVCDTIESDGLSATCARVGVAIELLSFRQCLDLP